ncbi:hypothetical protein SISNIDRAFT_459137 [Sistotremastrum niveocremeum HHB9708]|uniref:Mid2 domain-containing protein n=1 Tax=Sistotremastrum niveocremeum HHB9708 TaxID=1314777 RepID=A0A164PY88_9AGAM|nr:hypothetical protein SISNIDRAFT_459137 [Sistotremastrum niveocremeum HHB9708]
MVLITKKLELLILGLATIATGVSAKGGGGESHSEEAPPASSSTAASGSSTGSSSSTISSVVSMSLPSSIPSSSDTDHGHDFTPSTTATSTVLGSSSPSAIGGIAGSDGRAAALRPGIIAAIVVPTFVGSAIILALAFLLYRRISRRRRGSAEDHMDLIGDSAAPGTRSGSQPALVHPYPVTTLKTDSLPSTSSQFATESEPSSPSKMHPTPMLLDFRDEFTGAPRMQEVDGGVSIMSSGSHSPTMSGSSGLILVPPAYQDHSLNEIH